MVVAPLYEYLETPGLRFYRGTQEFIVQVEAALQENSPLLAAQRHGGQNGTWDERASQLAILIQSLLRGQPYSYPTTELHPLMEGR